MKKIIILCFVLMLALTGCSTTKPTKTTSESSASKEETEYTDPYIMEQIKEAFYKSDFSTVETLAKEIHELYPDTLDDFMAQKYLEMSQKSNAEKEKETESIDFKSYIQLIKAWTSEPNSAGGIDLYIKWKNTSDKTIKYITFSCDLYNAVNDRVACDIRDHYTFHGKVTGPIEPGTVYGDNKVWESAWWNNSGEYPKIVEIEIEYMDGSEVTIPRSRIDELFY